MKKSRMRILVIVFLVCSVVFLSSCKTEETKKVCVVAIVGAHNNFPRISEEEFLDLISEDLDAITENGGVLKLIRLDGSPDVISGELEYTLGKNQTNFKERVVDAFDEIKPCTAEVNLAEALRLASREIQSYKEKSNDACTRLTIIDSGISTKGSLSLSNVSILWSDLSGILKQLNEEDGIYEFPDYTKLRFIYLGETVYPQKELSNKQRNALERFYCEFFEKSNISKENISIDKSNPQYQKTGVDGRLIWEKAPIVALIDVDEVSLPPSTKWRIGEQELYFQKNSAQLKSQKKAHKLLAPVIDKAIEDSGNMIYLEGFTATAGTRTDCVKLSERRCKAVKKILCDNGIKEENVVIKGYGQMDSENFKRYEDIQDGSLVPSEARKNRVVGIIIK